MTATDTARADSLPRSVWALAGAWTLASTADNFVLFVLLWNAEPQGWSGLQTALLVIAIRLPAVAGGVLGGRAVDRAGPTRMIVIDGWSRALLMFVLALISWTGQLNIWAVLAVGAIAGTTAPFSYSAARTMVPSLVAPGALGRANSLLSVGDQLPLLLGAVLSGPALALLGTGPSFLLPGFMMLGTAIIAHRLRRGARPQPRLSPNPISHRASWTPRVIGLVALSVAYYFTYGPFETVLPLFVREGLGSGLGGYTLLWILFGAASLLTLPAAGALARRRPGLVNAAGATLWGGLMLPLVFVDQLPVFAVGFVVAGAIWGPYSAIEATALQRWTPPADHGRVFGTQRALLAIASPLGAAAGALAADHATPQTVLAFSAGGCAVAGLLAATLKGLRRSD
ncbi:MFS transporter [Kribbella sp. NPDC023855]|uniref:MFS transporter n=1 Tax=Kribbella sp. NPDC023855 TaxID=3154698 RepID=UPI003402147F